MKLWTDDDIKRLVSAEYSWLLSTFEGYTQNIQRADIARLLVVHAEEAYTRTWMCIRNPPRRYPVSSTSASKESLPRRLVPSG